MQDAEQRTASNRRLSLVLAFNYGGRAEIARAVRALATEVADGGTGNPARSPRRTSPSACTFPAYPIRT